jgi:hypothetical protein
VVRNGIFIVSVPLALEMDVAMDDHLECFRTILLKTSVSNVTGSMLECYRQSIRRQAQATTVDPGDSVV